ncbi:hypothetical protein PUN28_018864 [Cardiocondyla obscurior]|uniref:Uncharacterized protein n=1 Tax=Cardiocondyla obscurior TaxID=286306 RepID=A0AAW2ED83_9HYME
MTRKNILAVFPRCNRSVYASIFHAALMQRVKPERIDLFFCFFPRELRKKQRVRRSSLTDEVSSRATALSRGTKSKDRSVRGTVCPGLISKMDSPRRLLTVTKSGALGYIERYEIQRIS